MRSYATPARGQLAVDGAGNTFVAGQFSGTLDLGGGPLTSAGGEDIFVAKLSSTGAHLWSKSFGDAWTTQTAYAPAVDAADNALIVGYHLGSVDVGGGPTPAGGYITKLDPNGVHLSSRSLGSGARPIYVEIDSLGHPVLAGMVDYGTSIDFGWGPIGATASITMFLAKID